MLLRKKFENLHAAMAILVLFEQLSGKFCINFLTLILSASPNMMHFVRKFSFMRAYGIRTEYNFFSRRRQGTHFNLPIIK